MRRLLLLVLLVLLPACGSEPQRTEAPEAGAPATASPPAAASPQATEAAEAPPPIEGLEVLAEDLSREHLEGAIEYDRTPPLGGPHNARWLACDVYDEPVPHEHAVHSLEHGAVWLAHDPDLPQEQVRQLAELARRSTEYVLVSPEAGLDSRVVAVAWGAGLEASSADDPRLAQFVDAYAGGGQGGEPGAPCRRGGVGLAEARGMLGTAA